VLVDLPHIEAVHGYSAHVVIAEALDEPIPALIEYIIIVHNLLFFGAVEVLQLR